MLTIGLPLGHVETPSTDKPLPGGKFEQVYEIIDDDEHVSDTLRWLSQGPHSFVVKRPGYDINGYRFHTRERDEQRVHQNSGVSLIAATLQVASAKDKNSIVCDMSYYGVLNEIWDIDYHMFIIPLFKCDWVQNNGGVKIDEFGFTLVDLNHLDHKSNPFILASQAAHVFYVLINLIKDGQLGNLMDKGKGLADEHSNEESIDYSGNKEVPDDGNSSDKEVPNEFPNSEDENDIPKSSSTARRPTKNSGRMRMSGGKLIVKYNVLGVPVGTEATELSSFIGLLGRTSIPDINQEWRKVTPYLKSRLWEFIKERFIVHPNSKKQVFQALGSAFRNFKYFLTRKFILPRKHNRKRLKRPHFQYSHIPQNVWDKFVNFRLSTEFERIRRQQQNKRAKNKWKHRLSKKGYVELLDEICSETGLVKTEVDRSVAWKHARKMKKCEYDLDAESVVKKIDALEEKAKKREFKADARNDILASSIGKPATSGHMQGVGKFISPKMYFDTPKNLFQMRQERLNILERLDKQEAELSDLKKKIKKQPRHSNVGSSNFPLDEQIIEDEAEEMTARNEDKACQSIGMTRN
ncbi:hypothetical protein WN943_006843 [Citrus x changshan-huyou]